MDSEFLFIASVRNSGLNDACIKMRQQRSKRMAGSLLTHKDMKKSAV